MVSHKKNEEVRKFHELLQVEKKEKRRIRIFFKKKVIHINVV
jgi:hypothetical protein